MDNNNEIRVLIILSDINCTRSIASELRSRNFKVEMLSNSSQAISIAEIFRPHVIILGNRFPEGDIGISRLSPNLRGFMKPAEVIILIDHKVISLELVHEAREMAAFSVNFLYNIYEEDWIYKEIKKAYSVCIGRWAD